MALHRWTGSRWVLPVLFLLATINRSFGSHLDASFPAKRRMVSFAPRVSRSSKSALILRGGGGEELVSKDFLATFYAVNRFVTGMGFGFFTGLAMKLFHKYETGTPFSPANKATRFAGTSMVQDGLLVYLAMKYGLEGDNLPKLLGVSLAPLAVFLLTQEASDTTKCKCYRQSMLAAGVGLGACAASLFTGSGLPTNVAVIAPALLVGGFNALCLLFPETIIRELEWTSDTKDPQFRFLIRSIATNSSAWLAIFVSLWQTKNLYQSLGVGTAVMTPLALITYLVIPDMKNSGAPTGPMYPFLALFGYMSWRFLKN